MPTEITSGNPNSPYWIVGEAPGYDETQVGRPFVGASGQELTRLLSESGMNRNDFYLTNVCHVRPPSNDVEQFFFKPGEGKKLNLFSFAGRYPNQHVQEGMQSLWRAIDVWQPRAILAVGGTALWALSGESSITKWRGSQLSRDGVVVVPTFHPAHVLRQWSLRPLTLHDMRRFNRVRDGFSPPDYRYIVAPRFGVVEGTIRSLLSKLDDGPLSLACDIETRAGQIACVGIAWSVVDAMCIPFMSSTKDGSYWTPEEEYEITLLLRKLLTHPNIRLTFQNGPYDIQYFSRQWGYAPKLTDDTLLMQHVCFPGLPKDLAFLSSMYCSYHKYWKDDLKEWDTHFDETRNWTYNCEDCVRTFEIKEELDKVIDHLGLRQQYNFLVKDLFPVVLKMMLRGIRIDFQAREGMKKEIAQYTVGAEDWLAQVLGHPLNVNSSQQMKDLFYHDFGMEMVFHKKTKQPTTDDSALEKFTKKAPILRPLCDTIRDIRSARMFRDNFLSAETSPDGRMRSSINLGGTETFRFSSSQDAFGTGMNLQNISKGDDA